MSNTLIVDGDNLLTIGFFGCRDYYHKEQHIGGIYHFLNTLRKMIDTHQMDKIIVFWDGNEGPKSRRLIYPAYKKNTKSRFRTDEDMNSYSYQRTRLKQYMEEFFIRQGEYEFCESDDCIAYYTQTATKEQKVIYSSDGDLTQLITNSTKIYHPFHHKFYDVNDTYLYHNENILIHNVKIVKMVCGDPSDNIDGIKGLGIKTLLKLFPEIQKEPITIRSLYKKSKVLLVETQKNKALNNMVNGITKNGELGHDFFKNNKEIIELSKPFITDEAKRDIDGLVKEKLDPKGRSYKNTMKMMMEDGLFQLLPKTDDGWINFLNPFLKLTRKEKNKSTIKIKEND